MIEVVVVDDHALLRNGVCHMLAAETDIEVVAEADSGEQAIAILRGRSADVVLMDIGMPGIGGLEATHKLLRMHPEIKVVVVTSQQQDPMPKLLLDAGAVGYLTKGRPFQEIVAAIRKVYAGKRYVSNDIAQVIALNKAGETESPIDSLSKREIQVLLMIGKGMKNSEISDKLCLSPKTVSTYRSRLFSKLDVHSDVELAQLALRYRLIDPTDQA
jgi:DNA-binding NarL/FixJ family response regulator